MLALLERKTFQLGFYVLTQTSLKRQMTHTVPFNIDLNVPSKTSVECFRNKLTQKGTNSLNVV